MTFAPRFAPDGNSVIMSLAVSGASQIYTLDLQNPARRRRSPTPTAIDTSPCYSPDASQIVFNSDRGGSQQLYVMNADGSNIHRISFGNGRYGTPVWSPRGDLIAFTKFDGGQFYIGVMHPDGSRRAPAHARLPGRGAELGAQWARPDVFSEQTPTDSRGNGGTAATLHDRSDRL